MEGDETQQPLKPLEPTDPLVSQWDDISSLQAQFSKTASNRLIALRVTGNSRVIRKVIRGIWECLTWREKIKILAIIHSAFASAIALGHYIPFAKVWGVLHGR